MEYHKIGLISGTSKAMADHAAQKRSKATVQDIVNQVKAHNE
jgi:hypothetical protein